MRKVFDNRVFIKPFERKDQLDSGLLINNDTDRSFHGEVIFYGEGVKTLKKGDIVRFQKQFGTAARINYEDYTLVDYSQLSGIEIF